MINGNEAFLLYIPPDSLLKPYPRLSAAHSHLFFFILSSPSFCLTPPITVSRWCIWCCSRPILQTASQGHSQSKCMLMLCFKGLPGVPSTLSPTRCGTWLSQGGGSRCKGKGGPEATICQAVESHLTTQMDTVRPTAPYLMELWMFNGALLAWNAEALKHTASFSLQPCDWCSPQEALQHYK